MTRVKICGITNLADALAAADAGADAIGFVFYAKSPRAIRPEVAREIIDALPPFITPVGLFVNEERARIGEIVDISRIRCIQLHGDEEPSDCVYDKVSVIKALRVQSANDIKAIMDYTVAGFLLDAYCPTSYGGSGTCFDWRIAVEAKTIFRGPLILAGGLTPDNVANAIGMVHPYAVDVSSGVERSPGVKDHEKMRAFVNRARATGG